MINKAIIYIRVSSSDQIDGTSLATQEEQCRAYCGLRNLSIAKVFRDEGESAKTADRPGLLAALDMARSNDIGAFIVWKIDRLSRNAYDFHFIKAKLSSYGIRVHSVTEPCEDDPTGRLMENILSGFAQFDNEIRAERSKGGMAARARNGFWVWDAPLGYKNARTQDNCPTLEVDPQISPLLRRAFNMAVIGKSQVEVLAYLNSHHIKTKRDRKISKQSLNKILRNPVYAGLLKSSLVGPEPIEGKWEAIVDRKTWHAVQKTMKGSNGKPAWHRENFRDEFPLRGYIRCAHCNKPLTASWNRGSSGKKYPYYRCPKCIGTITKKSILEFSFCKLLEDVKIDSWVFTALKAEIEDIWKNRSSDIMNRKKAQHDEVKRLSAMKDRLIDLLVAGSITQDDYDHRANRIGMELTLAENEETEINLEKADFDAAIEFACRVFNDPASYWMKASPKIQNTLASLIFDEPPAWDGKKYLNIHKNKVVNALQQNDDPVNTLVTPRGFEPLLQG